MSQRAEISWRTRAGVRTKEAGGSVPARDAPRQHRDLPQCLSQVTRGNDSGCKDRPSPQPGWQLRIATRTWGSAFLFPAQAALLTLG